MASLLAQSDAALLRVERVIGQVAGEDEHTLIATELPSHSHALLSSTTVARTAAPGPNVHIATTSVGDLYAPVANAAPYSQMAPCLSLAGQSLPHNNIMPTVVGNYCICAEGVFPSPG